jgi:hypothetical protein
VYRGTNTDHTFSLQWDACKTMDDGGHNEVTAQVLDSQAFDAARTSFSKTTRFDLRDMPCRPPR